MPNADADVLGDSNLKTDSGEPLFPDEEVLHASMHFDEMTIIAGGAFTTTQLSSYYNAMAIFQAGAGAASAVGSFTHPFNIESGTFTLYAYATKASNSGIYSFYIDGIFRYSWDTYAAVPAAGRTTIGSVTLVGPNHTLGIVCTGKNASSSGYTLFGYKFAIY